jgi:hypothetical protein
MVDNTSEIPGLQWQWVGIGTFVGVVLATILFYAMSQTFHTFYVPLYIGLISFVIMGIIIGYNSPGYTLREPAIGGGFAILLTIIVLRFLFNYNPPLGQKVIAPVFGFFLSLIGGWVGEELQGSHREGGGKDGVSRLEWGWIIAGAVIGFILNNVFVFGLYALLHFGVIGILCSLGGSFVAMGMIVGYKSPGITIKEAAIAGVVSVVLNFLVLHFGFKANDLPIMFLIIGLIGGFIFALVGGWMGERLQKINSSTENII